MMGKNKILILAACLCFTTAQAQDFTTSESSTYRNDSLFKKTVVETKPMSYSLDAWANQTSNTITAGFMNSLAQGGFISQDELNPIMDAHTGPKGYLGGTVGFDVKWTTPEREGKLWSLCGSFGSEAIVDTRWTTDLFELVWFGNAASTGELNILSGSGARAGIFNRFNLGGYNHQTGQRLELSFVQRLAGAEWSLPYGYFNVSENADSLDTYVQSEARLHIGSGIDDLTPAYGIALSGSVPIKPQDFPVELEVNFKDVGLLFEPEGSRVYWMQDGLTTTGLPVFGDSLTWESIYNGDITPESAVDSILQTGNSVSRMVLLPAKLGVSFKYHHSETISANASIYTGGWMPQHLITGGLEYIQSENITLGLNYKQGGWGDERFEFWARINVPGERNLLISVEEPLGLMFRDESAASTTCRGIRIRLSRGNG